MPELPEVEVVKRQLEKYILQRKIDSVKAEPIKLVNFDKNISDRLRGLQFVGIERVGKLLIFETDKAGVFVLCHLKMTGQLIFVGESGLAGGGHTLTTSDLVLPNKHTHVTVNFQDGAKLFFNDLRKFGYFKIADKTAVEEAKKNYGLRTDQ